jgi:hypothetical protein
VQRQGGGEVLRRLEPPEQHDEQPEQRTGEQRTGERAEARAPPEQRGEQHQGAGHRPHDERQRDVRGAVDGDVEHVERPWPEPGPDRQRHTERDAQRTRRVHGKPQHRRPEREARQRPRRSVGAPGQAPARRSDRVGSGG